MKFTFDQLTSFIAVAEEEHFGRAAERLHMTQPPLSRQMQTLEKNLQVTLFDRRGRRTRLTAAGSSFLVEARRLLSVASHAEDVVRSIEDGQSGTVHVGFTSVVGNAILPRLFSAKKRELCDIRIELHEVRTPAQSEALLSGRIDLALGRRFELCDDLVSVPLPPDGLVVVAPAGMLRSAAVTAADVSGLRPVSLTDLAGRDFVTYTGEDPHHVHDAVAAALTAHDVQPHHVQRAMEVYVILSFVDAGVGAAIVPRSTLNWAGRNTDVFEAPELAADFTRSYAVWHRQSINPALPRVLAILKEELELGCSAEA